MKKISLSLIALVIALAVIFVLTTSVFTVQEAERGLLSSSKQNMLILSPGLHYKWPWQSVDTLTMQNFSNISIPLAGADETINLAVLWNISDVNVFLAAGGTARTAALLKTKLAVLLPAGSSANFSLQKRDTLWVNALQNDPDLLKQGIVVQAIWIKGITPSDALQSKIFNNMQGLAATIGQSIIASGQKQAEAIRSQAQADFLTAQKQALDAAAAVVGAGNSAAVKTMAALYHSNPVLFKAYVAAKLRLLTSGAGS